MKKTHLSVVLSLLIIFITLSSPIIPVSAVINPQNEPPETQLPDRAPNDPIEEEIITRTIVDDDPHYSLEHLVFPDGRILLKEGINGSPTPPPGYTTQRADEVLPESGGVTISDFPSFKWVFGCGAVSGGMIAAYYDRNGYPNIYTGPTNGGVYPLTDTDWPTWTGTGPDAANTYPNNPLVASKIGVDGRTTRGSIDNYWVGPEGSTAQDPFITNSWTEHTWGTAVGDYMKTSQSNYGSTDGNSWIYTWPDRKMTCTEMETINASEGGKVAPRDFNYGNKLFYQARGYSVTECYNERSDNNGGGFTLARYKAEIDAGYPVLIWVKGHFMVGYGYSGSTIYIRDTWDNNPNNIKSMEWGGKYGNRELLGVAVIHLQPPVATNYQLTVSKAGTGSGTVTSTPAGVNCGSTCSASYTSGTTVTLTASPSGGSTFSGWSGACTGTSTTCTVSMTQNRSVTATFNSSSPPTTFWDVPTTHWAYSWIMQLFNAGITTGCGGNYFCPEQNVTRDQMAIFILRSMYGRNYTPPPVGASTGFYDVPTSHWAAAWIKQLAAVGITTGCGGGNYCPSQSVSRDQMAIFILRGMYGSAYQPPSVGASTGFFDVDTWHWAAPWIKQLAAEGITTGCGGGNYCPSNPVTRAQMAVFLVRAFLETTPPPPPPPPAGFNSQFKDNADGWIARSGDWYVDDDFLFTYGISGTSSSVSYNANYSNFDYQVNMGRYGTESHANRILIRGTPLPLKSNNWWSSGYMFQYSREGKYSVWKFNPDGSESALQNWTYTPAIVTGANWNILRVVANGSSFAFYINGTLLWTGSDASYSSGQVGIGMYRSADSTLWEELIVDWAVLTTGGGGAGEEFIITDVVSPEQQALNEVANIQGRGTIDSTE